MIPIKYEYTRTITRVNQNGIDVFVGYISLTKYRLIKQQPYLQYERAEQFNSTYMRNVLETPPIIAQLPEGDTTYELTEEIYNKLVNYFLTNQEGVWIYMASI